MYEEFGFFSYCKSFVYIEMKARELAIFSRSTSSDFAFCVFLAGLLPLRAALRPRPPSALPAPPSPEPAQPRRHHCGGADPAMRLLPRLPPPLPGPPLPPPTVAAATGMPACSALDSSVRMLWRHCLPRQFFSLGWGGQPRLLQLAQVHRQLPQLASLLPAAPTAVSLTRLRRMQGAWVLDGWCDSPAAQLIPAALPHESHRCRFQLVLPASSLSSSAVQVSI